MKNREKLTHKLGIELGKHYIATGKPLRKAIKLLRKLKQMNSREYAMKKILKLIDELHEDMASDMALQRLDYYKKHGEAPESLPCGKAYKLVEKLQANARELRNRDLIKQIDEIHGCIKNEWEKQRADRRRETGEINPHLPIDLTFITIGKLRRKAGKLNRRYPPSSGYNPY